MADYISSMHARVNPSIVNGLIQQRLLMIILKCLYLSLPGARPSK